MGRGSNFEAARLQLQAGLAAAEEKASNSAPLTAWSTTGDAEPAPPPRVQSQKPSLSSRLALAAGIGKGIKSIGDIAKPSLMRNAAMQKTLRRSPLDSALADAVRCREDGRRAMAEGEINLNKMYARDHDGLVQARALLVGANKSITKLMGALETLEGQATAARSKLESDQTALHQASSQSIEQLTAHRAMLTRTLLGEINHMENDSTFSISQLLDRIRRIEEREAALGDRLTGQIDELRRELKEAQLKHVSYVENAERIKARLAGEIARLCTVVEELKASAAQAADDAANMHAQVVATMSGELAEKQRTIDGKSAEIRQLQEQLAGTSATLTGQLRDLSRQKAEREARLEAEKKALAEQGRQTAMALDQRLGLLKAEKEQKEKALSEELRQTAESSAKQAETLKSKIEKMRKLQELALGGVAGADGNVKPAGGAAGRQPSTRGRQLLYYESMKSKSRETSSMSWRGDDVFAHEKLGIGVKDSPK